MRRILGVYAYETPPPFTAPFGPASVVGVGSLLRHGTDDGGGEREVRSVAGVRTKRPTAPKGVRGLGARLFFFFL